MSDPSTRFDEIYNSTNKQVRAFVIARCRRTADIADILQDTYLELYQILTKRGVEYVTHEKALVMRIAKNKLSRYYGLTERLRMFVSATVNDDEGEEVDLTELAADDFLTEDFAVNQIMYEHARQLIRQKPEGVKKVFYLYYDAGLTMAEIAAALSVSESAVKHRLYRTLKELREMLNR